MDLYTITQISSLAGPVMAGGSLIYTWLTSRSVQNSTEIADMRKTLADHGAKLQALEQKLLTMPDKDTVHGLDMKVTELNGVVNVLAESMKAVERTAHRIEEFLLNQSRK